jgi:hypothetical protein
MSDQFAECAPATRAYYLAPIDPADPSWEASTIRSIGLWVAGLTDSEARRRAAHATALAVRHSPGSIDRGPPWLHPDLAICELGECPFPLRPGLVVDEMGKPVDSRNDGDGGREGNGSEEAGWPICDT